MRDVARHAGVSVRTVSNVVNDFALVSDDTRARVRRALADLGYQPNLVARNLRQGRSGMIALVLPELGVPYFSELTGFVIDEAGRRGYTVIIDQTDGDPERERQLVLANERAALFDGLIFSPLALSAADLISRTSTTPVVLLGERVDGAAFDHIAIDNVAAARAATEHLIGIGRSRIAAIGDQPYETGETAQYRTQGYGEALNAAGRQVDPELVIPAPRFHRADGAEAMTRLLDRPDPPDAVFCYNDLLALGALRTLHSRGLKVPQDVAVAGFDDTEDGRFSTPTLTTIAPDKRRIAHLAVDRLFARLGGDTGPPVTTITEFSLQIRESTGGPGL